MMVVDARNLTTLSGNVDLTQLPRLREALFGGTNVRSLGVASGSKIEHLQFGNGTTSLTLQNLKFLETLDLNDSSKIEFFRVENCEGFNPFELLKTAYNLDSQALKDIRIIGFVYNGDSTDADMLANFANDLDKNGNEHPYNGINSEGAPTPDAHPVIEGTLNIAGSIYEDSADTIRANYPNLTLIVEGGYYIRFADPVVQEICATNWGDGAGTGITKEQAAAVTTFGTAFKGNTDITSFDEARYFAGLKSFSVYGFQKSTLKHLNLSGLQNVSGSMLYAFDGMGELETLNVNGFNASKITSLQSAFANLSKITRIDLSSWTDTSGVNNINGGMNMFNGCTSLLEINLPENFCPNAGSFGLFMGYQTYPLKKITGWFNCRSARVTPEFGYKFPELRQVEMRNVGENSSLTTFSMISCTVWGVNSEEVPDARQSLKNTFDYLFDRASAGYDACTITLSTNTLNEMIDIFGDDGMLSIINKGYTIANYTPIYPPDKVYDNIASLDGAVMFYNSGAEALAANQQHAEELGCEKTKIDLIGCIANGNGVVSAVYDMSGAQYSVTNVSVVDGKLRPTDSTTFGKITLTRTKECSALYYEGTPLLGSGNQQVFINNILQSYTGISAIFYQGGKTNIQVHNVTADVKGVATDTINQLLVKVSGGTTADISLVEVNGNNVTAQLGAGADFWGSQGVTPFITIGNDFETFYAG